MAGQRIFFMSREAHADFKSLQCDAVRRSNSNGVGDRFGALDGVRGDRLTVGGSRAGWSRSPAMDAVWGWDALTFGRRHVILQVRSLRRR
jgi:hypothetical protein